MVFPRSCEIWGIVHTKKSVFFSSFFDETRLFLRLQFSSFPILIDDLIYKEGHVYNEHL